MVPVPVTGFSPKSFSKPENPPKMLRTKSPRAPRVETCDSENDNRQVARSGDRAPDRALFPSKRPPPVPLDHRPHETGNRSRLWLTKIPPIRIRITTLGSAN